METGLAKERDRTIGVRDGRRPDEVIASIDSSDWAVDPVRLGMTAMEYQHGETKLIFSDMLHRAGQVNTFFHFPRVSRLRRVQPRLKRKLQ